MFIESLNAIRRAKSNENVINRTNRHKGLVHTLPLKMRFKTSGLYISAIPPFAVGIFVGILSAIMGVGGGFIMVPAMIYILGMPTKVVVGTSLFQIFLSQVLQHFYMLHKLYSRHRFSSLLLIGGVIGAQIGTQIGSKMRAEQLRILLSVLVLLVCLKLATDLLIQPSELFSLGTIGN